MRTYTIGQFSKITGRPEVTLRRWDFRGKFKAHRTPTNRRFYTQAQLDRCLGKPTTTPITKHIYLYARVSSYGQKDDLCRQIKFLEQYANARGYQVERTIKDIGSGMNYNRRNWNKLIRLALQPNTKIKVVVAYPDRFTRFGFKWFQRLFEDNHCVIEVINHHKMSPNQELVSDLISIIQVFSSKLYGLRKYKNKLKKDKTLK